MSPNRTTQRSVPGVYRVGIMLAVAALAIGAGVLTGTQSTPTANAKPINPYVPCSQWQQMHPGWPCWGNFPEIEEPTVPGLPPGVPAPTPPSAQPTLPTVPPSSTPAQPPAAALTPPPPRPAPDPCKAIVPVPGYIPPALPGHPAHAPCGSPTEPRHPPNARDLIKPYVQPVCSTIPGIRVLSPGDVHEIVTEIIGPLEDENPDDPFVQRIIDRTNTLNKGCFGNRNQIEQELWNEFRDEWYRIYRDRNRTRDRKKKECDRNDHSKDCEGVVAVCTARSQQSLPQPMLTELDKQRYAYLEGANEYIRSQGYPAWRIRTTGTDVGDAARKAAEDWRQSHPQDFPSNPDPTKFPSGVVAAGHVPDTVWSGPPPGKADPYRWEPMDKSLNSSIGWQATRYPVNYKARAFVPGDWEDGACVPSPTPYALSQTPPYAR